jgi:hypothetical protein
MTRKKKTPVADPPPTNPAASAGAAESGGEGLGQLAHITPDLRPLAGPIGELVLDPANARTHDDKNLAGVGGSMRVYTQRTPIVVNRRNNVILKGNGTVLAARKLAWSHLAIVWVDDDASTAAGYSIADNRAADITGLLSSVGFSSPPAWCRPFHVLSNGEQFRVSMALALATQLWANRRASGVIHEPIVIDEFTSVVDRTVAQIGSAAVAKAVRSRPDLQFVGVSCHYDVIDWLQPDWLFEPASGLFTWRLLQPRPALTLEVLRAGRSAWALFRRHHYLNHDLGAAARCFVGLVDGRPATFTGVTSFPHPVRSGWREHRTVCLPDFQGVGMGNAMSELIGAIYHATGKPYRSVTSHPAMIRHRLRSPLWKCIRRPGLIASVNSGNIGGFGSRTVEKKRQQMLASASSSRLTASFEFVGPARIEEARKLGVV